VDPESGLGLRVDGVAAARGVPVVAGDVTRVQARGGSTELDLLEGEVALVDADADGEPRVRILTVGVELRTDALDVLGDPDQVALLADELEADLRETSEGWRMESPELLAAVVARGAPLPLDLAWPVGEDGRVFLPGVVVADGGLDADDPWAEAAEADPGGAHARPARRFGPFGPARSLGGTGAGGADDVGVTVDPPGAPELALAGTWASDQGCLLLDLQGGWRRCDGELGPRVGTWTTEEGTLLLHRARGVERWAILDDALDPGEGDLYVRAVHTPRVEVGWRVEPGDPLLWGDFPVAAELAERRAALELRYGGGR